MGFIVSSLTCSFLFLLARLILLIFFLTCITNISPQNNPSFVSKRGGVCFRVDDNQSISKFSDFAAVFNRYNQHFCFSLNLDNINENYANGVRNLQSLGHEMMDHTPSHGTNHFTTILSKDYYINHPGVQKVKGSGLIELKYAPVDINCAKRQGYANIHIDTLRCSNGAFANFSYEDCYLYFPALDKLVLFNPNTGRIDQNTIEISDAWWNSINLGTQTNVKYYNFDFYNIHLTIDAVKALIGETIRLSDYYNLQRPRTWIQPGSITPNLHREEIKEASAEWNFVSASGYEPSLKTFNEYNPNNDKQFGVNWGDISGELDDIRWCKTVVADRLAKHCISVVSSHFNNPSGGWDGYLYRTEQLIQWCLANNIAIKTYYEWTDILYNQIPDPNENIFPRLNIDLDGNNFPDGYDNTGQGILKKNDGIPAINDYCYSISRTGKICSITKLGGIEKGRNDFEIWTKGAPENFIEVIVKAGSQNFVYKFPAENQQWTKFNLEGSINGNISLNIPDDVSFIDVIINCSNFVSGEVNISGMVLKKYSLFPVELSSFTATARQNSITLKWQTKSETNNYGFDIERKIGSEFVIENWQKIGFIRGNGNSNSPKDYFFVDIPVNGADFIYRLKQVDNDGKFKYSNEVKASLIIDKFILYQNYPNPFNSTTNFEFRIPSFQRGGADFPAGSVTGGLVTLKIYDLLGREVAVLLNEEKPAGKYTVNFNATNLSSEIYFYQLKAGKFISTKRMMLLK